MKAKLHDPGLASLDCASEVTESDFRPKTVFWKWLFVGFLACVQLARYFSIFETFAGGGNFLQTSDSHFPDLFEASVLDLQAGLEKGHFSSVDLVETYFARIEEVNLAGPSLRAVIELNPSALSVAAALDTERKFSGKRSPLHGIPILLKDNIATLASEGMNTTAGSYSLLGSVVPDDAGVVKHLRKAGAIILGKANLSEWAHFRSVSQFAGWSGRGGQCKGAYFENADAGGSSSGSGVAASIGLAAVTLGTETHGSITIPSSYNNIVGIKPTVGLTSRAGVIPISEHQDSVGPMARNIADAAIVLSVIAGKDPKDNYTLAQPPVVPNYEKALKKDALKGKRIGATRFGEAPASPQMVAFEQALKVLRELGATIVDPIQLPSFENLEVILSENETVVLYTDFKVQINDYFSSLIENPSGVRTLEDLIAFNDAHPELEKPKGYEAQEGFILSQATTGRNASFYRSVAFNIELGATRGIDAALQDHNLDALVSPANGELMGPASIAGYPIVTVPLGFYPDNTTGPPPKSPVYYPAPGAPFGLSFVGTAWSEFDLISFAYAYEQKTQTRLSRKPRYEAIPKRQLKDIVRQH